MKKSCHLQKAMSILMFSIALLFATSCEKEVINNPNNSGGTSGTTSGTTGNNTGNTGNNFNPYGIWQRYGSPKGYNTDLAVGNIPGEPANRVYMCEHPGSPSAGLYKGYISGNIITWDPQYGLPNAEFKQVGNYMTLYFNVGLLEDAGKYQRGVWSNTCGELGTTGNGGGSTNNMDLNGKWISGGNGIQISGSSATFYSFGGNWQTANSLGVVNIGGLKLKNIYTTSTANKWTCQELYMTTTNNVINGTTWSSDGKISMSSDGKSITLQSTGPISGSSYSNIYTRVN